VHDSLWVVSLVLTGIMPYTKLGTDSPVADALKALSYNRLRLVVTAGALMGMISSLLVYQYGQARVWFAMSRDRLAARPFSRVQQGLQDAARQHLDRRLFRRHSGGHLGYRYAGGAIGISARCSRSILVSISVIVLRKKQPDRPRSFRVPRCRLVPMLSVGCCLVLMMGLPAADLAALLRLAADRPGHLLQVLEKNTVRWPSRFCVGLMLASAAFAAAKSEDGLVYGEVGGEELTMDYYPPAGLAPHPIAIIIHGGGYVRGNSKNNSEAYCADFLAPAGYAVFSINYRLAPKHPYPAMVEDVQRAIRYLRHNAKKWRADPNRIVLVGGSAGGYLSNMAGALNAGGIKGAKDPWIAPSARVQAVVTLFGPSDFRNQPVNENVQALLGPLN